MDRAPEIKAQRQSCFDIFGLRISVCEEDCSGSSFSVILVAKVLYIEFLTQFGWISWSEYFRSDSRLFETIFGQSRNSTINTKIGALTRNVSRRYTFRGSQDSSSQRTKHEERRAKTMPPLPRRPLSPTFHLYGPKIFWTFTKTRKCNTRMKRNIYNF